MNIKVHSIDIEIGKIELSPILDETVRTLRAFYGDEIQWEAYERMKEQNEYDGRDYWVQTSHLVVKIVTNIGVFRVKINRGWVTDLGSVPLRARSIIGHTNPKWLLGYLIHDASFGIHFLSFEASNDMLIAIGRFNKASWFDRTAISIALITSKAHDAYDKRQSEIDYERRWVSMRWDSK